MNTKKFFLASLIGALSVSALIGIATLLMGDFDEHEARVLLTTISIAWYSLMGMLCAMSLNKISTYGFGLSGIIIAILALIITILAIWGWTDFDAGWKGFMILFVLSLATAHTSLLLQVNQASKAVKITVTSTIASLNLLTLLFIKSIIYEFREDEFYFRLLGVLLILAILGSIISPILSVMHKNKTS